MAQTPAKRIQTRGEYIDYTPGSAVSAGDVVVLGNMPLLATNDIAASALGALATDGVFDLPKDSSTFSAGDAVYWNTTGNPVSGTAGTGAATSTPSGANLIGFATADAATGASYVRTKLTCARRTTTIAGSVTADDITGSDAALTIAGKAGTAGGAGGTIVLVGGAGHTAAAGGLVSLTGGAGAGAGAGGAASLVGGDSAGATGTAGATTVDAGAATGGTGANVTIGGTNAEAVVLGRSTKTVYTVNGTTFIVGNTAAVTTAAAAACQVLGTAAADSTVTAGQWSAAATGPEFALVKSRNATIGSSTIVQSSDVLGSIVAYGDDGTDFASPAGSIKFEVDTTPGANDMPGRIVFSTTADSGNSVTEACRITSAQNFCVSNGNALIVGALTPQTAGAAYEAQVQGTAVADSSMLLGCWNTTNTVRGELAFMKSGDAAIGSNTIVASGESLGGIVWYGDDGVDYTAPAASIEAYVGTTPGVGDMPGRIVFSTTADGAEAVTEVFRIDHSQNVCIADGNGLIVGGQTPVTTSAAAEVQVLGTAAADSALLLGQWSAAATGAELMFVKSRAATIGTSTIVQDNDVLGSIVAYAADGGDHATPAASISFLVNGTPGANDMPTEIVFSTTADGANAVTAHMHVLQTGVVQVNKTMTVGTASGTTGAIAFNGTTSGTVTLKVGDAAGTSNFVLPPDDGDAGEQLQTDGSGVTTWEAAGSLKEFKHLLGSLRDKAQEALTRVITADVQEFTYREKKPGQKIITTGDTRTHYRGVIGDDYPEVMHHNGRIFNPVSAFGELVLAIQALAKRNEELEARLAKLGI